MNIQTNIEPDQTVEGLVDDHSDHKPNKMGHCQKAANIAVRAMLEMLKSTAKDGLVPVSTIERIATVIMNTQGPLTEFFDLSQSACHASWAMANIERQRKNQLGRLIVEPIVPLLDNPHGIERSRLPQFLESIHLMLGEEVWENLRARATLLAQEHKDEEGMVDWASFHTDPEGFLILEQIQVAIARSFRRFEPRKDWMLVVLNSNPNSISIGPNAFVPKSSDEKVQFAFTQQHLSTVLLALFEHVRLENFDDARTKAFETKWGVKPQKVFGPFFVELLGLSQRVG